MKYKLLKTDKAQQQLIEIALFISVNDGLDNALKYLGKIENTLMRLEDFPESGAFPYYSILKKQGFRVIKLDRHLAFYKINEDKHQVIIYAIVDSRREYLNLI